MTFVQLNVSFSLFLSKTILLSLFVQEPSLGFGISVECFELGRCEVLTQEPFTDEQCSLRAQSWMRRSRKCN